MRLLAIAFVLSGVAVTPARAADAPLWTAAIAANATRTEGQDGADDQTSRSGSLSLTRHFAGFEIGGSIGASGDDTEVPQVVTVVSASSFNGALWWGSTLGPVDVQLTGTFGREDLDTSLVRAARLSTASRLPATFQAATLSVAGSRKTQGLTLDVSHTFGDVLLVTPFASLGVDRTTTDVNAALSQSKAPGASTSDSEEGVTGVLGATLARKLGANATLSFSAALNATDNAAARTLQASSGRVSSHGQNGAGAEQWGDFGAGLNLQVTPTVSVGVSLNGTAGREQNDLGGGVSLSKSF